MEFELSAKRFKASISSFYNDPAFSDVKLRLNGGDEIYAHKFVLSNKSGFFYEVFTGSFRKVEEVYINLFDDDPRAVVAMLRHVYDHSYDMVPSLAGGRRVKELLFYAEVFIVAERYDVPTLMTEVARDFKQLAETNYNTVDFLNAIQKLYHFENAADKTLHKCVQEICQKNIGELLQETEFVEMLELVAPLTAHLLTDIIAESNKALKPALYTMTFCSECENYMAEALHPAGVPCPDCNVTIQRTDATLKV
ncbi:hypothetical protein BDV97DRAFT_41648 [Delphinella strobiligena]|nr:hypothetical protein BDV97DRAFT_41648 [Delphinella strobiligena]